MRLLIVGPWGEIVVLVLVLVLILVLVLVVDVILSRVIVGGLLAVGFIDGLGLLYIALVDRGQFFVFNNFAYKCVCNCPIYVFCQQGSIVVTSIPTWRRCLPLRGIEYILQRFVLIDLSALNFWEMLSTVQAEITDSLRGNLFWDRQHLRLIHVATIVRVLQVLLIDFSVGELSVLRRIEKFRTSPSVQLDSYLECHRNRGIYPLANKN